MVKMLNLEAIAKWTCSVKEKNNKWILPEENIRNSRLNWFLALSEIGGSLADVS